MNAEAKKKNMCIICRSTDLMQQGVRRRRGKSLRVKDVRGCEGSHNSLTYSCDSVYIFSHKTVKLTKKELSLLMMGNIENVIPFMGNAS